MSYRIAERIESFVFEDKEGTQFSTTAKDIREKHPFVKKLEIGELPFSSDNSTEYMFFLIGWTYVEEAYSERYPIKAVFDTVDELVKIRDNFLKYF